MTAQGQITVYVDADDSPDAQAKFKNIGFEGFSSTPSELGDFIKVQLGKWGKMIKDANIQLD